MSPEGIMLYLCSSVLTENMKSYRAATSNSTDCFYNETINCLVL